MAVKDRLYCDPIDSISRRSTQTAMLFILRVLCSSVAPILPQLAHEIFMDRLFLNQTKPSSAPGHILLQGVAWGLDRRMAGTS